MAVTEITNQKLSLNTAAVLPAAVSAGTEGAAIDYSKKEDGKILILLENSSTSAGATATVKAGTGIQGVADLVVSLEASAKMCLVLESGAYVQASGEQRGKVLITGTNVKAAAVELP